MGEEEDAGEAVDAVFRELGWRGRYQLTQLVQVLLCLFPAAWNILAIVFIGKVNEYKCKEVDDSTSQLIPPDVTNVTYGRCSVTWTNVTGEEMETPCPDDLEFAEPLDRSLMSEWGLVCDKEALTDVSQTLLLVGMMVGAGLFTSLSDKYGRKTIHIITCLGLLVSGIATAFVPTFAAFMPLRFFVGAFQQGMDLTGTIMGLEILPARRRFIQGAVLNGLWATALLLLGLLGFLMRHFSWRYFQLLLAVFSAYAFLLICFLDESLRWLVANGRVDQAERILKKAAAQNKVNSQDVLRVFRAKAVRQHTSEDGRHDPKNEASAELREHPERLLNNSPAPDDKEGLPKYGLIDFFRHKHVFMCAVINGFAWCVNAVTYYGLSMTSVTLADDMYLGFSLSILVEFPAVVVILFSERFGRKRCCDVFHVLAGLSLLASVALSSLAGENRAVSIAVIVLSLVGKFGIASTFGLLYLYTPEQFPTNLRNASMGVASMAGRIGGMVAPYFRTLSRHVSWAPGVIFGVCCLLLPICMRMLPESCGRELPTTIEDMEMYITEPYTVSPRPKKQKQSQRAATV